MATGGPMAGPIIRSINTVATQKKSERRAALEEQIFEAHDFGPWGQAWSWDACGTKSSRSCEICGLQLTSYSGGQNSADKTVWTTAAGEPLTLAQAARLACE
jgi:hypothetical protein